MNKRLIGFITIFFVIGVILTAVFNWFNQSNFTLPANESYFSEQIEEHEIYIENKFPEIPVKTEIPYFSSDEYFDYRIMPSYERPEKFDIILAPRFSDANTIEDVFPITQSDILQWIANHDTLISNVEIDWYIEYNNQKIMVDQTNPHE